MVRMHARIVTAPALVVAALLIVVSGAGSAVAAEGNITVADGITLPYPDGWSAAQVGNLHKLVNVPADQHATMDAATLDRTAQILITTDRAADHEEALHMLRNLAASTSAPVTYLSICGWPGVQRRHLAPKPRPGGPRLDPSEEMLLPQEMVLEVTTAVAAGNTFVRVEGRLPSDAPPALADAVEAIGRGLECVTPAAPARLNRELQELRNAAPHASAGLLDRVALFVGSLLTPAAAYGATQRILSPDRGELEVAVSSNGQNVVVATQFVYATSTNGGVTFPTAGGGFPSGGGDPSLAFGLSGNFYHAAISGNATGFDVSTDGGVTWSFRANAFVCPSMGMNACNLPDQEHIAADRFNAASPGGGDMVYSAWRQLNGTWGIVCSNDSGANWSAGQFFNGDLPRIGVGSDGRAYVVFIDSNNLNIRRFSRCDAGLTMQQLATVTTLGPNFVDCAAGVPGLDRCNDGNNLSSWMVAVDDTSASHVYVVYAINTATGVLGNENTVVRDSADSGATWNAGDVVTVNSAVNGRRYLSWVCSLGGAARVSWYDRRNATAGSDDLTDYFCGSASRGGGGLVAGTETNVTSGTPDPECAAGKTPGSSASWAWGVRAMQDAESCSTQPQLAGRCCDATMMGCPGSQQVCDFTTGPACPAGETCNAVGGGCPKYGDYNGNACAAGRIYNAWASATAPSGIAPASTGIDTFFSAKLAGNGPDLSILKTDAPDPMVAGTDLTYTLTVTNDPNIPALQVNVADVIPANTTFQSVNAPAGFSCTTPPVGGTGSVTCTRNFTLAGDVAVLTLVVHVNPSTPNGTIISNTATVMSADPDPNPGNNSATATTGVITQADLATVKNDTPDPVISGAILRYFVTITNNGPSDAQNPVMTQGTPTNTTFESISPPAGWTCVTPLVGATGTITCDGPSLAAGASVEFLVRVRVSATTPTGTVIDCTVNVSSSTTDPNLGNNPASTSTQAFMPIPIFGGLGLLACILVLLAIGAWSLYPRPMVGISRLRPPPRR